MIKEAIEFLQVQKRPEVLTTYLRDYLYNDGKKQYEPVIEPYSRSISNVDSLVVAVLEEARRRNNDDGSMMTVIFNAKGARFYPNDKERIDQWTYNRSLSQQWLWLRDSINAPINHLRLIRVIQGLRPSLENYREIFNQIKKVSFTGKTIVTSQPIMEDGQAGSELAFNLQAQSGAGETKVKMPGHFTLDMQYAKASSQRYNFDIELDGAMDDGKISFKLVFPEHEIIEDQAIRDEVAYFVEKTRTLPYLLTLLDL